MARRPHALDLARIAGTALVCAVLLLVLASPVPAAAAPAQDDRTTTSDAPASPDIIPEPNSGSAPDDAGDRGGALQTVLFVAVLAGIVAIGALIVRESRKAREQRGF